MARQGSCHCGRIAFEVEGDFTKVMECNCSHCLRKGFLLAFVPRASFTLKTPESAISTYLFNKHVIQHKFCPHCGAQPFAFGRDREGRDTVAINVRCLDDIDLTALEVKKIDGRNLR